MEGITQFSMKRVFFSSSICDEDVLLVKPRMSKKITAAVTLRAEPIERSSTDGATRPLVISLRRSIVVGTLFARAET